MKRMLIAVVLLLSMSTVARADDASKRATAEKLIASMHVDTMMNGMIDVLKSQSAQMMQGATGMDQMNDQQKKLYADFQNQMIAMVLHDTMAKLMPLMVDVYVKSFSEEELNAMYAFYSSPIGQSVVSKMPEVTQNSMAPMGDIMKDLMPKIQSMAEEFSKKMQAAGTPVKSS